MSVKERIKEFIKSQNITISEFEKQINVANGYVNSISKGIGTEKIEILLEYYPKLNLEWLITGSGKMLKSENISNINDSDYFDLPMIPFDYAAGYSEDNPGIKLEDCEKYRVPEFKNSGAEYVVRVNGSSMYPKYSSGDILACKRIYDILFFQWGKVYVIDSSQGQMVKRIFEHEDKDMVLLVSDNKEKYPPFPIPKSDIRSLSIVLGVIRME